MPLSANESISDQVFNPINKTRSASLKQISRQDSAGVQLALRLHKTPSSISTSRSISSSNHNPKSTPRLGSKSIGDRISGSPRPDPFTTTETTNSDFSVVSKHELSSSKLSKPRGTSKSTTNTGSSVPQHKGECYTIGPRPGSPGLSFTRSKSGSILVQVRRAGRTLNLADITPKGIGPGKVNKIMTNDENELDDLKNLDFCNGNVSEEDLEKFVKALKERDASLKIWIEVRRKATS